MKYTQLFKFYTKVLMLKADRLLKDGSTNSNDRYSIF